jgi:hypothetical protein
MLRREQVPLKARRLEMSETPKNQPAEGLKISETTAETVTAEFAYRD